MYLAAQMKQFFISSEYDQEFTRSKTGWVIIILNMLCAINSAYAFLTILNTGVDGWLMMNSCAPSIFIFTIGFLVNSPVIQSAGALMMFRYGTLGLFVFSWDGYNIIAQVGHIFMTIGVIYFVVKIVKTKQWKNLILGLLLGAAILVPYLLIQNAWFDAHPGVLEKLFSGTLQPGK
ncbi:MAG: hypothetical protein GY754_42355 [bacterium]|nr:hypothetical protein [bacterium]